MTDYDVDKEQINELISRRVRLLDEREFTKEHFLSIFTEDTNVELPPEGQTGIDQLADLHERTLADFASTHHMTSDKIVDFQDGARAFLRVIYPESANTRKKQPLKIKTAILQ